MRRTALAATTAAAMLVVAPLLTACGSSQHPGAAAVVGGERITVAQVQSHMNVVRDAQSASPNGEALIKKSGMTSRTTLRDMIRDRTIERAAEDNHVEVTRGQIESVRDNAVRQLGGQKRFKTLLLEKYGVAPGAQTDDFLRIQALGAGLQQALGATDGSPEAMTLMNDALARATKELKIDVNPRYGKLDPATVFLTDAKIPWVKQVTPAGSGTQKS
jgi:hypothetical protein